MTLFFCCSAAFNCATVSVSSFTFIWSDLTYSTVSSSMSEVLVCLSMLGTRSWSLRMRSLILVRRTRSAMLRGWVAHPRFARVRICTKSSGHIGSAFVGKLMWRINPFPPPPPLWSCWPVWNVIEPSAEPLDVSLSPGKPRCLFPGPTETIHFLKRVNNHV